MFSRFLFNAAASLDRAAQAFTANLLNGTYAVESRAALAYANGLRRQGQALLTRAVRYEGLTAAVAAEAATEARAAVAARKAAAASDKTCRNEAARLERDYA